MAQPRVWKNVAVSIQSAIDDAIEIIAISKANPAVVTFATGDGAPPANGTFVSLESNGMSILNGRGFRVVASGAGTFSLEGVDSTTYETFTSGSFRAVTIGTSITTMTSISAAGGDIPMIDTSTIHVDFRSQIPDIPNASSYSADNLWDVSDAGLIALKNASDAQRPTMVRFTFGLGGPIMVFNGYVGATLLPGGAARQLITTPTVFALSGPPTYYAG